MNQEHKKQPLGTDGRENISCGQDSPKKGRLQSLVVENGELQITVVEGTLPAFLMEANTAVKTGNIDRTLELLNDRNVEVVRNIVRKDPTRTDIMLVLAKLFSDIDQLDKAEEWYSKVLDIDPHPLVFNEICSICLDTNRFSRAVEYRKKAVEANPHNNEQKIVLARDLIETGETQKGIDLLRKVIESDGGNAKSESSLLWNLHYLPDLDPQKLFDEYKRLGRTYVPLSMAKTSHDNAPDPDRRLRIGYISPDFHQHSVVHSFEPLLDAHNRDVIEVYGYGNVRKPDAVTDRLMTKFDHYRDIFRVNNRDAASLIEQDKIDILVEIGGICRGNRLDVLACKPAPIQVDYGGINTSGMEQIDYRLTDSILDPPDLQKFYVEESICLPGGLLAFRPPEVSPVVSPLPAKQNGFVTFASFNNNMKINTFIIELWVQILKANEGSRLILKFRAGNDEEVKNRYRGQFEDLGIEPERIDICGWKPDFEHYQLYHEIDIALDTYPFNGFITTLQALWMGVPVISLVGTDSYLSRAGLSILSRVGLEIFAATSPEEYVTKAVSFAAETENLEQIRLALRQLMLGSTLCDPGRYAVEIEAAYRKMWRRWCQDRDSVTCSFAQQEPGLSEEA